jgi:hypothetical protein
MKVAVPPRYVFTITINLVALPSGNAVWAPLVLLRVRQRVTEGRVFAIGSVRMDPAPENSLYSINCVSTLCIGRTWGCSDTHNAAKSY